MEAPACEEGFRTLTKTLGDWRNTRVKQNTRTAMEEGLKKKKPQELGCYCGYSMCARLFKSGQKAQTNLGIKSVRNGWWEGYPYCTRKLLGLSCPPEASKRPS